MNKIAIDKEIIPATREFLRKKLKSGKIKGVFTLGKAKSGISYMLITDPKKLDISMPFYPLMPENAAALLSELTFNEKLPEKIIAVIRPCELQAFVELAKRTQAIPDNIVFMSLSCNGVIKLDRYKDLDEDGLFEKSPEKLVRNEIRPTCLGCIDFIPETADIKVDFENGKTIFYFDSNVIENLSMEIKELDEAKYPEERYKSIMAEREEYRKKMFEELDTENFDIEGLIEIFGRCIGCHGCSHVCPICFCALCAFESKENELLPQNFENELEKRGGMRIPTDTVLFHLGRMTHMSFSCVGCGMCTDICPVDIPVSQLFVKAENTARKLFGYIPGESYEEKPPLSTFVENEFTEVED